MEPHPAEANPAIGDREGLVLTSIVENYIASGDPVGSQAVARQQNRDGLSAATVRHVMVELSEAGYLEQPHTSAGRVPTSQAFRYYVEQLLRHMAASSHRLPQPTQEQIDGTFSGVANATDFFAKTSHLLALLSGGVGVALTTLDARELLEHVHFARLGPARVLTVLVTTAGVVRDRLLLLDRDLTPGELEAAANYLNANFHGWTLHGIRDEISRRIEDERSEYYRILHSLEDLWTRCAIDASSGSVADRGGVGAAIFVDGATNLIVDEVDRDGLRRIFSALEEKQRIIDLLRAYVNAGDSQVRVVVGLEDAMPEMRNLVLVAAPAKRGAEHLGTVAVIGPTRMQYASNIGTVNYIADLFGRWAARS